MCACVRVRAPNHCAEWGKLKRQQSGTSDNVPINLSGSWTNNDNIPIKLSGSWTNIDNVPINLSGYWTNSDNIPIKLSGSWTNSDNVPINLSGSWTNSDNVPINLSDSWIDCSRVPLERCIQIPLKCNTPFSRNVNNNLFNKNSCIKTLHTNKQKQKLANFINNNYHCCMYACAMCVPYALYVRR